MENLYMTKEQFLDFMLNDFTYDNVSKFYHDAYGFHIYSVETELGSYMIELVNED